MSKEGISRNALRIERYCESQFYKWVLVRQIGRGLYAIPKVSYATKVGKKQAFRVRTGKGGLPCDVRSNMGSKMAAPAMSREKRAAVLKRILQRYKAARTRCR